MVNCTRLLYGIAGSHDHIRYRQGKPADRNRPIVVWNVTRKCNLRCRHCYIDASLEADTGELTTAQAKAMIDDLASFGVPALLFSGGEPFLRKDLFSLGRYAVSRGLRTVISTNGTLISQDTAKEISQARFSYVGISWDGLPAANDNFRRQAGAFKMALQGIRNCVKNNVRVGLRFTINKYNFRDIAGIFDLIAGEGIERACFYHLVYSGRGASMASTDLSPSQARKVMDLIFSRCRKLSAGSAVRSGAASNTEILTVDNHADGVYLYLRLKQKDPRRAEAALSLLKVNGGNKSGIGIANIDHLGFVHADQFWGHYSFGNVRERRFSEIWMDESDPLLKSLRNRLPLLKGKCGRCNFKDLCGGNFRVRAEAAHQDTWQEDPACYLTEEEITSR